MAKVEKFTLISPTGAAHGRPLVKVFKTPKSRQSILVLGRGQGERSRYLLSARFVNVI